MMGVYLIRVECGSRVGALSAGGRSLGGLRVQRAQGSAYPAGGGPAGGRKSVAEILRFFVSIHGADDARKTAARPGLTPGMGKVLVA